MCMRPPKLAAFKCWSRSPDISGVPNTSAESDDDTNSPEANVTRSKGSIYGKLAVAVGLGMMDETGVNTDDYLKLPLKIEAEARYDEAGFCDNSPNPWGISVESSVGAVVGLEAWK